MSVYVAAVHSVRPVILRFYAQSHTHSHIVADMDVCMAVTAYIVPFFLSEDHFYFVCMTVQMFDGAVNVYIISHYCYSNALFYIPAADCERLLHNF